MEIDGTIIWNVVLTLIIAPFAWAFNKMFAEVKRLQILLNKTREEYATRQDLRDTSGRVMEALQLRENFTIDVTYYVGLGAFIHTIDGVSGAEDWSTYWGFYQDGVMAEVGASTLLITSDTNLSWVLTPA